MTISAKQYKKIAAKLTAKGLSPDDAYKALEKAKFTVKLKGETLKNVYASRVMALMYNESEGEASALEL